MVAVCVILTNRALTGANEIVIVPGAPCPCAIGWLQVVPSVDTCTSYARGKVATAEDPRPPPTLEDVN